MTDTTTYDGKEEVRTACDNAIQEVHEAEIGMERPAYDAFIDPLAATYVETDIVNDELVDECLTRLKDADGPLPKPVLESSFEEKVEEITPEEEKLEPLETWMSQNCTRVIEVKDDDTGITDYYTWVIDHEDQEYRVETEDQHNNWYYFSERLKRREMDFQFAEPERRDMGDWKQWVWNFIRRRRVVVEKEGPRTMALEDLQNRLEVSQVYLDLDKANTHSRGVYMESRDADVMYVSGKLISSIAEDHGISNTNVLQDELDKRGVIDGGASTTFELDNGQSVRFWRLPTNFADVKPPADESGETSRARGGAGGA